MNGLMALCGILALLLLAGGVIGLLNPKRFAPRWLLVAALLVTINDALLTRLYGALPDLLPASDWNWQGKLLALAATLAIAALPAFGWRRIGLTLAQHPGSLKAAMPVALLYCAFFLALAVLLPNDPPSADEIAFQLTMPGLDEELFYRGVLLLMFNEAFGRPLRVLGAQMGWGAVLTSLAFGLVHALGYDDGAFTFSAVAMATTGVSALLLVWIREKTGSLLLPVLLHNFGNAIFLLV